MTESRRPYQFSDADRQRSIESRLAEKIDTALLCSNCHVQATCDEYKAGSVCSIDDRFEGMPSRSPNECLGKIRALVSILEERTWRSYYFEQLDGGRPNKEMTRQLNELIRYQLLLAELLKEVAQAKDYSFLEGDGLLGDIFGS